MPDVVEVYEELVEFDAFMGIEFEESCCETEAVASCVNAAENEFTAHIY